MNSSSSTLTPGMQNMIGVVLLVEGLFFLAFTALMIWLFWRIFAKAGMTGPLALLNLIPGIGNLVCILLLAFSTWPIEQEVAMRRAGYTPQPTPPYTPPGTPPIGGPPMAQP